MYYSVSGKLRRSRRRDDPYRYDVKQELEIYFEQEVEKEKRRSRLEGQVYLILFPEEEEQSRQQHGDGATLVGFCLRPLLP